MQTSLETAWSHVSIPAELASVRPLGDFVLVRMLPESEMHRNLIWLPQYSGAHADRQLRPVQPSIGEVVAAGPGDPAHCWICGNCGRNTTTTTKAPTHEEGCVAHRGHYWILVETMRHRMHISPGDRIMYWRSPANEVVLNEETFQFLHEEQHILGVIEDV